jgi:hypothetical protein
LRGLFERDRKLLGLMSQTAYAAVLRTFQAALDRTDVRPGCVVSLQTYGAYSNRASVVKPCAQGDSADAGADTHDCYAAQ